MSKGLEIYRLSGLSQKVGDLQDVGRYAYWTNGTHSWDNSRAYNRLLALVNLKLDEIAYLKNVQVADLMNELDFYIVCLEALQIAGSNYSNLMRAGSIINTMAAEKMFVQTFTDDEQRARNLDGLIETFTDSYNKGYEYEFSGDFAEWWKAIKADNYNDLSAAQKSSFERFFSQDNGGESIGATEQKKDFADYIRNAGDYFLYIFIPKSEIRKYNLAIQQRYAKENELYDYVCNECVGMYDRQTVLAQIRNGVVRAYKMTPENKIEQLQRVGNGGVGELAAILTAVAYVIAAIASLIGVILSCVQVGLANKYSAPADEELGIPQTDDWGIDQTEIDNTDYKKWLLLGGVGLAGYYFLTKNK